MATSERCSECGAAISAAERGGLCTLCLLSLGLSKAVNALSAEGAAASSPSASFSSPQPSDGFGGQGTPDLQRFGDYDLIEEIARGGMGIVYRARQRSLDRIVAVKRLLFGPQASPEVVRRFRVEASAAGALQHPNIVAIHEVGLHEGQHYLAMDFVDGPNLAQAVRDQLWPARRAARCVQQLAEAVQYAHERGILHRDLKPSNVLLAAADCPRVTDFGLAKRLSNPELETRNTELTLTGQVIGSPAYMPPEQAMADHRRVGRASDVYSLGAILYHLVTGRAPFQAETPAATMHQVLHAEPVSPRLLQPGVPADLETICLKCLEKEPTRRYPTAQALADELGRFLRDEPIHARPISRIETAWRWCRRKPALASLWAAGILLLVAVSTGLSLAALRNAAVQKAEQREYFAGITLADNYVRIGDIQRALDVLTNCPPRFRHWEWGRLMYLCHQEIETIVTVTNQRLQLAAGLDYTRIIANIECTRSVTVGEDGAATGWDLNSGAKLFVAGGSSNRIRDMAFAPDGRRLALLGRGGAVEVWEATAGRKLFGFQASNTPVQTVSFSVDGANLRITSVDSATVWDARSGQHVLTTPSLPGNCLRLALAPDGTGMATLDSKGKVQLWDGRTGEHRHTLEGTFPAHTRLFFSPDGSRLLTANPYAGPSIVWDARTASQLCSLLIRVDLAVFSADGSQVATVSGDNVPRIWSSTSGREILALKGHRSIVRFLAFSRELPQVITASEDHVVKTWRAGRGREYIEAGPLALDLAFSPDGTRLAVAQDDHLTTLWDLASGRPVLTLRGHLHRVNRLAFSPDGKRLITSSFDQTARVWDAATGREQLRLRYLSSFVSDVAFSPDGHTVATAGEAVRIWDGETGREIRVLGGESNSYFMSLAFSPDGKQLVTGGGDGTVLLWDPKTGRQITMPAKHSEQVMSVVYSPDGRFLATAGYDRLIHLWDPSTGKQLRTMRGHLMVRSMDFSPDAKRLVTATIEFFHEAGHPTAQVWDVETGRELIVLDGHNSPLSAAVFSPDGRRIATCDWNGVVLVQESFPWREKDYPGASARPMGVRARDFARDYWRDRLAVDTWTSSFGTNSGNVPPARIDRSEFPARDPKASANLIDLTEQYNALLTVSWFPKRYLHLLTSDLSSLPRGNVEFTGVAFDVRGLVQLRAPGHDWLESTVPNLRVFPNRVDGIRLGRRFARLHALLGTIGREPDGTTIGSLVLHFANGSPEEMEIKYGHHVRDWWTGEDASDEIIQGSVVWKGTTSLTRSLGGGIRVFKSRFDNPRPASEITTVDFVSKLTRSGPFLIALTLEP